MKRFQKNWLGHLLSLLSWRFWQKETVTDMNYAKKL